MIERLSLNSLKFFYFVAKYASVTLAAKNLFVTQSAVSKQLYNLEASLDIALFIRKNKTLTLTAEGQILFDCCQHLFTQLDECLIHLQNHQSKQFILSCEPTLSMKWLIPRLSKFKILQPDIDIVLLTAGGKVDFEKNKIDLAIRRNDFDWGAHIYHEKIADEYIVLVQKANLDLNQNLLISTSRANFLKNISKIAALKKALASYTKTELEHFYLCLEGCLAGLGDTVISSYMIEKELESGILSAVSVPVQDGSSYFLLSPTVIEQDPRKLIFLTWLRQQMTESQSLFLASKEGFS